MKLSDVKGERVFDVIADIIEPVANIAQDENAMELFVSKDRPDGVTPWEHFVSRAKTSIPAIMRKHRDEICTIMATVNGVTVEEYVNGVPNPEYDPEKASDESYDVPKYNVEPLNVIKLFADVLDLVTDSEFVSFFS